MKCNFSSDTTAPVCSEIMEKLMEVNHDAEPGYSDDRYSKKVVEIMQSQFTKPVGIHMCTSGSASNILSIKVMKHNYSSIICCDDTHCSRYEVGGTEYNTGCKFVTCKSNDAKLTVPMIQEKLKTRGSINWAYPEIVVLSQVTELGTCYTCAEIKEICDFCHKNDLYVYIDGARLANAMEHEKCGFKEMLEDTGVDIASFGANKNGAMFGEMIIVLNPIFEKHFILQQKQSMQLFSKTRFLGSQFLVMLENEIWRRNAKHSNDMAHVLEEELKKIGRKIVFPVESNCVFTEFTEKEIAKLKEKYNVSYFEEYPFVRLMTSWCTTKEEIEELIEFIKTF